jgi:hypothetical protein
MTLNGKNYLMQRFKMDYDYFGFVIPLFGKSGGLVSVYFVSSFQPLKRHP